MEPKTKLLDQMRVVLRLKHLSPRTEHAYINWAKRFIVFHGKRHPKDMGAEEIRAFLTHLALHRPRGGFNPECGFERVALPVSRRAKASISRSRYV